MPQVLDPVLHPDTIAQPVAGVYSPEPSDIALAPLSEEQYVPLTNQDPTDQEEYGALSRGFLAGVDQLQGDLAGLVGVGGDLLYQRTDWEPLKGLGELVRDWGYEEYLEQQEEAAQYGELTNFTDIGSPESFFTWVAETAGQLAPSIIGSIGSAGVGAAATQIIGRRVSQKLAQRATQAFVKKRITRMLAQGVTKKEAQKRALAEVVESEARNLLQEQASAVGARTASRALAGRLSAKAGALAGSTSFAAGIESGGNWVDDVDRHGIENTSPGQDLLFGVASGLTELGGGEASLIRNFLGRAATDQAETAVKRTLTRRLAEGIAKGSVQEGFQEFVQESLSAINANIQDEREWLTRDDVDRLVNAFAAGAVGGVLFGGAGSLYDGASAYRQAVEQRKANSAPDVDAADVQAAAATTLGDEIENVGLYEEGQRYRDTVQPLIEQQRQIKQGIADAQRAGSTIVDEEDFSRRDAALARNAAQIALLKQQSQERMKTIRKQAADVRKSGTKAQQKAAEYRAAVLADPSKAKREDLRYTSEQINEVNAHLDLVDNFTQEQQVKSTTRMALLTQRVQELQRMLGEAETDYDFLQATDSEYVARRQANIDSIKGSLDSAKSRLAQEEKFKSELLRRSDRASRALANFGTGESWRISQALEDLFRAESNESPYDLHGSLTENELSQYQKKDQQAISEVEKQEKLFDQWYDNELRREEVQSGREARAERRTERAGRFREEAAERAARFRIGVQGDFRAPQVEDSDRRRTTPETRAGQRVQRAQDIRRATEADRARQFREQQRLLREGRREAKRLRREQEQRNSIAIAREAELQQRLRNRADVAEFGRTPDTDFLGQAAALNRTARIEPTSVQAEGVVTPEEVGAPQFEAQPAPFEELRAPETTVLPTGDLRTTEVLPRQISPVVERDVVEPQADVRRGVSGPHVVRRAGAGKVPARTGATKTKTTVPTTKIRTERRQPITIREGQRTETTTGSKFGDVTGWVETTLNRLPVLREVTQVARDAKDERVPQHVRKEAQRRGLKAAYDPKTNRIYIFANRITNRQDAIKQLLHEGIGHYGLMQIMDKEARDAFFDALYNSFGGTRFFKLTAKQYRDLTDPEIAEEYFARLAERIRVKDIDSALSQNEKTVWSRFKKIIRGFLSRVGLAPQTVTKVDINNIQTALIHYLANKKNIGKGTKIVGPQEVLRVRGSRAFLAWTSANEGVSNIRNKLVGAWRAARDGVDAQGNLTEHRFADRVVESLVDQFRRMIQVQKFIENKTGKAISISNDVYRRAETFHNRESAAKQSFRDRFIDGKGGLIEALGKAVRINRNAEQVMSDVDKLAYALHAKERNAALRRATKGPLRLRAGSGMTDAEADAIIRRLGSDGSLMAAVRKVQEINDYRLELLEKNKIYPPSVIQQWRKTFQNYVPLQGWSEEQQSFDPTYRINPRGTSYTASNWEPPVAKGRTTLASSPTMHTIRQAEDTITMVEKARVNRAFLNLVRENPNNPDLWVMDNGDLKEKAYTTKVVKDKESGVQYLKVVPRKNLLEGRPNVITVIDEKGEPVKIQIKDEALYQALTGANVAQIGDLQTALFNGMGKITRVMSVASTYMNPEFVISNAIRDMQASTYNLKSIKAALGTKYSLPEDLGKRVFKDYRQSAKTLRAAMKGENVDATWSKALSDFQEYGGYTDYLDIRDLEAMNGHIRRELKAIDGEGLVGLGTKAQLKANAFREYLEDYSGVFENMTRLSTFKNISESLIGQGMAEQDAKQIAANAALNITVNFTKRGSKAPLFSPLYMFANATLQANYRLFKTLTTFQKGKRWHEQFPVQLGLSLMAAPVMFGMLGRFIGGDDEDGIPYYDKVPNYIKNSNIVIMLPGTNGSYLKLPMAYGFHLFTTFGNMAFSTTNSVNPPSIGQAAAEVLKSTFNNFSTLGGTDEGFTAFVPTALRPWAQVAVNRNFMGNPIRPEQQFFQTGEYPSSQQYWSNCNRLLVGFADNLNRMFGGSEVRSSSYFTDISPENMEHIIQSYTGGAGQFFTRAVDFMFRTAQGGDIDLNNVPFTRRVLGSTSYYQTAPIYFDLKQRIQTDNNEVSLLPGSNLTGAERTQVRRRLAKGIALNGVLTSSETALKNIRKRERAARRKLSGSALVNELDKLKREKERTMNRLLKSAKARGY